MNSRYGNVQRSMATVRSNLPASEWKPGANSRTMTGAATMPTMVMTDMNHAIVPTLHLVFRDDRNEGLRERAFGEQAPHEVRDLERDQERVHQHSRAEHARVHHVAQQAGHPRKQGQAADDAGAAGEAAQTGPVARIATGAWVSGIWGHSPFSLGQRGECPRP